MVGVVIKDGEHSKKGCVYARTVTNGRNAFVLSSQVKNLLKKNASKFIEKVWILNYFSNYVKSHLRLIKVYNSLYYDAIAPIQPLFLSDI